MTLLILIGIVVASTVVHEGGHALAAWGVGWKVRGIVVRWYGVGLKIEVGREPRDIWKVAAGGLVASALLTAACFTLSSVSTYLWIAFVFNAVLLVSNLIPIPISDGRHLVSAVAAYFYNRGYERSGRTS